MEGKSWFTKGSAHTSRPTKVAQPLFLSKKKAIRYNAALTEDGHEPSVVVDSGRVPTTVGTIAF
jgi:hypothetical protein